MTVLMARIMLTVQYDIDAFINEIPYLELQESSLTDLSWSPERIYNIVGKIKFLT